jgi:hypothetical protein
VSREKDERAMSVERLVICCVARISAGTPRRLASLLLCEASWMGAPYRANLLHFSLF